MPIFSDSSTGLESISILIVSDQPLIFVALQQFLGAQDGISAIEKVANSQTVFVMTKRARPDVLLLDGTASGYSGLAMLAAIKSDMPEVPIVLLSFQDSPIYILRAFRLGVSGYVLSMAGEKMLVRAIREAHAGRIYFCPRIERRIFELLRSPILVDEGDLFNKIRQGGKLPTSE